MGPPRRSWMERGSEREWVWSWRRILTTSSGAMTKLERCYVSFVLTGKVGVRLKAYRAISPAVAPAAVTWSREPSSLRRSLFPDIHPATLTACLRLGQLDLRDWSRTAPAHSDSVAVLLDVCHFGCDILQQFCKTSAELFGIPGDSSNSAFQMQCGCLADDMPRTCAQLRR